MSVGGSEVAYVEALEHVGMSSEEVLDGVGEPGEEVAFR